MSGRNCARYVKVSLICVDLIIFLSGLIMLIGGSVIQSQINSQYLLKNIGKRRNIRSIELFIIL
jgi:hypothetical protein